MRSWLTLITLTLFIIPVISGIYKTHFLGLSILPQEISSEWNVQIKIPASIVTSKDQFHFPSPVNYEHQKISHLRVKDLKSVSYVETKNSDGNTITWKGELENIKSTLGYEFRGEGHDFTFEIPKTLKTKVPPRYVAKYLKNDSFTEEDAVALEELQKIIIDPNATVLSSLKKIFFYVSEEIRQSQNQVSIVETLALGRGSNYTKVKIFNYLARNANIPSRMGMGIQLEPDEGLRPPRNQYRFTFFSEVYLDGKWFPVDLQQRKPGALPPHFIIIHRDITSLDLTIKQINEASVYAIPLRTNRFNSKVYSDELKRTDSVFYTFSLYSLPVSAQSSMYIVLLLPIGAVCLSFFRNIIGFTTFGIFTPVLLTIFFIETNFTFALTFFALVVFLGFFQRILLDKLYLLAVPRISILLTFVIIAYLLFILINNNVVDLSGTNSAMLSYFPVVIITILIERFSIDFIEEGSWNTLKKLSATITISAVCYFVLTFDILKQLIFTNPELLLWTIALNLLIGNYKGYRLSEFIRFRDLAYKLSI
jgi:hypothetical protein